MSEHGISSTRLDMLTSPNFIHVTNMEHIIQHDCSIVHCWNMQVSVKLVHVAVQVTYS